MTAAIHKLSPSSFQATWHRAIELPNTAGKTHRVAWNALSLLVFPIGLVRIAAWGVKYLADRYLILPALQVGCKAVQERSRKFQEFWFASCGSDEMQQRLRTHFTAETHSVLTPDGASLNVILIKPKKPEGKPLPTVVCFNGNGGLLGRKYLDGQEPHWVMEMAQEHPCNLVFFDYRGTGLSGGTFENPADLVVDGASVIQWVEATLNTTPDQIHFYGYSLGGSIAVRTKALDPDRWTGSLLHERSFSSMGAVAEAKTTEKLGCLVGKLARLLLSCYGYETDIAAAFRTLKGRTLIVYDPKDEIIPYKTSLHAAGLESDSFRLEFLPEYAQKERQLSHHRAPISYYRGAAEAMTQSLFPSAEASQAE